MLTDLVRPTIGLAAAFLLGGCVTTSTTSDYARVRELTRATHLAASADADVDPATREDVRRLVSGTVDADTAVRIAVLNNRELRASLREMGIARGRLVQAGLLPNPVVEAELLPERNSQLELRVEYDLTRALLAPLRARAAEPELEAARYRAAAAVVDMGYSVRAAFYALQAAEERLAVAQRALDAYAAGRDASQALLEAGNVPALDSAAEAAAYERARVSVAQVELDVADRREGIQRLLGLHGGEAGWSTRGPLPEVPANTTPTERLEAHALTASLDLAETRSRAEGLARRAGLERVVGWLPDVSADVHGLHGTPEHSPGAPADGADAWRFGGGLSMSVPLFDRRQGATAAVQAELDALMERYYGLAVDVRSAARDARNRLASAHARARQYQDVILPALRRVSEETLLQYNAMQVGIFQVLASRREQLDAELAMVETRREYWTAAAALDALLAGRRVAPGVSAPSATMMSTGASESAGGH